MKIQGDRIKTEELHIGWFSNKWKPVWISIVKCRPDPAKDEVSASLVLYDSIYDNSLHDPYFLFACQVAIEMQGEDKILSVIEVQKESKKRKLKLRASLEHQHWLSKIQDLATLKTDAKYQEFKDAIYPVRREGKPREEKVKSIEKAQKFLVEVIKPEPAATSLK